MFFCFLCLNLFLTLIWKGNVSLNIYNNSYKNISWTWMKKIRFYLCLFYGEWFHFFTQMISQHLVPHNLFIRYSVIWVNKCKSLIHMSSYVFATSFSYYISSVIISTSNNQMLFLKSSRQLFYHFIFVSYNSFSILFYTAPLLSKD
jgi:uncharacterized membrane protein